MASLTRPESATAWELRGAWAARQPVVLVLTERCCARRVEGLVEHVATTDAFVVCDGWHVPMQDVLAVRKPHHTQKHDLRA